MKINRNTFGSLLAFTGLVFVLGSWSYFTPAGPATTNPLPAAVTFAGETVPLHDQEVKERFDREMIVNTYWHSQTILHLKRANRWFPVIEPILKKNNVPDDFKFLAVAESGLTNDVSPAGATGFWQILEATAREYGLEVSETIDERYHVEKSTEAACRYLKTAYDKFGSWTLAAASYNLGMKGVADQQQRQKQTDYYALLLPEETSRYVLRILAIKTIHADPASYGFQLKKEEHYPVLPVNHVTVDSAITDLPAWAKQYRMNYKTLKLLNPWLRQAYLDNPDNRSYDIKVPGRGFGKFIPLTP